MPTVYVRTSVLHLVVFVNHRHGLVSLQVNRVLMTFNLISPIGSPILPAAYWLNLPNMVYLSSSPPSRVSLHTSTVNERKSQISIEFYRSILRMIDPQKYDDNKR
jgi:hypothetical protein